MGTIFNPAALNFGMAVMLLTLNPASLGAGKPDKLRTIYRLLGISLALYVLCGEMLHLLHLSAQPHGALELISIIALLIASIITLVIWVRYLTKQRKDYGSRS